MAEITLDFNKPADFEAFKHQARMRGVSQREINALADAMSNMLAWGHLQRLPDGRFQITPKGLEFVRICTGG